MAAGGGRNGAGSAVFDAVDRVQGNGDGVLPSLDQPRILTLILDIPGHQVSRDAAHHSRFQPAQVRDGEDGGAFHFDIQQPVLAQASDHGRRFAVEGVAAGVQPDVQTELPFGLEGACGFDQGMGQEVVGDRRESVVDVETSRTVLAHRGGVDDDVAGLDIRLQGTGAAHPDEVRHADVGQLFDGDGRRGAADPRRHGAHRDAAVCPRDRAVFPVKHNLAGALQVLRDAQDAGRVARQQHVAGSIARLQADVILHRPQREVGLVYDRHRRLPFCQEGGLPFDRLRAPSLRWFPAVLTGPGTGW